jgi:DNA polymerase elongation subunit (family B)
MTNKPLKTLFLDIETAPNLGYTWQKYETNVIEFVQERYMLCFTVKWLDDSKYHTFGLPDFPDYTKDPKSDKALMTKLWDFVNEADVIVAHNGDSFDIKIMNTRFIVNGFTPPSPYKTVDTKKEAKKKFGFNSNSLNDLGQLFGFGKKADTGGFKLWTGCMSGDTESWKKMKKYNKIDVALLEQIYLKLRGWMKNHPNVSVALDRACCQTCGSNNTQKRGFSYTKLTKYQRLQCMDCHSWSQGVVVK